MSWVVLLNPLFVFSIKSSLNPPVLSIIKTSPNPSSLFITIVQFQTFLFFTDTIMDVAPWKLGISFLTQRDMYEPQEVLPIHDLFKPRYLTHILYPTNLHSFQEPVKHGTSYIRPLSLSHTTCLFSNLTLTNLILFLSLLNLSFSSFFGGFAIGLRSFPQHYILKKFK